MHNSRESELSKTKNLSTDTTQPTNRFKIALEKTIKEYVDDRMKSVDFNHNKLLSPKAYREKLEAEVRKSLDLTEFSQHVTNAVNILQNEGQRYLSKDENEVLLENLNNLRYQLNNLDLNHLENDSLKAALLISTESRASIQKIGIAKYNEKHLSDSLSIFAFLASLDSENPDYWYRLGLVAQESELNDLALRAYTTVLQLTPEFIGARIFKAQCYLNTKQRDRALMELAEIKNLLKTIKNPQHWNKHIFALENLLAA